MWSCRECSVLRTEENNLRSSSRTSMMSTKGVDGSLGIKVLDLQSNDGNDVGSYKNEELKTRLTNSGIS